MPAIIKGYTPCLIVENISNKAVNIVGLTTIDPGQIIDLYKVVTEWPSTQITEVVLRGFEKPYGDLYIEAEIKQTIKIHCFDVPAFHFSVVNPSNLNSINSYYPGAVPSALPTDEFEWIDNAAALSGDPPISVGGGVVSISQASLTQDGYLTKEDYALFLASTKQAIRLWQYQDFPGPVSTSLTLSAFENGTGLAFNSSYVLSGTAQIVLSNDVTSPPTTTTSIPGKWLPGNRVNVTSHIGTTVILDQAPVAAQNCRVYYLISLPANVQLPNDYQEDPEFLNDADLQFIDENYVNQNQDEIIYGEKTFNDNILANAYIGVGTPTPVAEVDVAGTTRTTAFQLPTGATDGYFLKSDALGFGSWSTSIFTGASAPVTPYPGQPWIRVPDYQLFIWDSSRGKWLSPRMVNSGAARDIAKVSNLYLYSYDGIATNIAPFVLPFDATLVALSASGRNAQTWTAEIHQNNALVAGASLSVIATTSSYSDTVNVDFSAGDKIQFFMSGSQIAYPRITAFFAQRA